MNAFDFDNTLYHGESSVDLAIFMIRNNKKIILWLPKIFINLLRYKLCLISRERIEELINSFMQNVLHDREEVLGIMDEFWAQHAHKLDTSLISRIGKDDIIISAGPSFLLEAISDKLGTHNLICSEVDFDTMSVARLCFGENKVKRFRELYGDSGIGTFYTDSYNDKAFMDISEQVFIVKKGRIKRIK
ncbi:MAG: haloacid dehalogenase-like hydrolase [Ruminococcus sp.]|nr:haloacid dehalogenase-like hydrolase [Ruminococcus sp.]